MPPKLPLDPSLVQGALTAAAMVAAGANDPQAFTMALLILNAMLAISREARAWVKLHRRR